MNGSDHKLNEHELSGTSLKFLSLRDETLAHWECQARERVDGARELQSPVLTNTLPVFYENIAEALTPSYNRANATSDNTTAAAHGGERARMTPYGVEQVVQEYQIFREAIAAVSLGRLKLTADDWLVIDQSINSAVLEAVKEFTSIHDGMRRRLAAALSHDMRNPLSVINAGAQLIELASDLPTIKNVSSRIRTNAKRLESMMSELLDALTYKGGSQLPLAINEVRILDVITQVAGDFQQVSNERIEVHADDVVGFWCEGSLRRGLENLVSNALKYGDGSYIRIMANQIFGRLILSVHNTGSYIPKDRQQSIFEYRRRGNQPEIAPGWGIGLEFVKTMAESHGGNVVVDSSMQSGTTFTIDLPVDCRPYANILQ